MAKLKSICENWRCGVCDRCATVHDHVGVRRCPFRDPAKPDFDSPDSAIAAGWKPFAVLRNLRTDRVEPPFIWRYVCPDHRMLPDPALQRIIDACPAPGRWAIVDYASVVGPAAGADGACVSGSAPSSTPST